MLRTQSEVRPGGSIEDGYNNRSPQLCCTWLLMGLAGLGAVERRQYFGLSRSPSMTYAEADHPTCGKHSANPLQRMMKSNLAKRFGLRQSPAVSRHPCCPKAADDCRSPGRFARFGGIRPRGGFAEGLPTRRRRWSLGQGRRGAILKPAGYPQCAKGLRIPSQRR